MHIWEAGKQFLTLKTCAHLIRLIVISRFFFCRVLREKIDMPHSHFYWNKNHIKLYILNIFQIRSSWKVTILQCNNYNSIVFSIWKYKCVQDEGATGVDEQKTIIPRNMTQTQTRSVSSPSFHKQYSSITSQAKKAKGKHGAFYCIPINIEFKFYHESSTLRQTRL